MYKCRTCGEVFCDDEIINVIEENYHLPRSEYPHPERRVVETLCPNCSSDDFGEADECKSCGDMYVGDGVLCRDCADFLGKELENIRVTMDITMDDFQDAIANHFGW